MKQVVRHLVVVIAVLALSGCGSQAPTAAQIDPPFPTAGSLSTSAHVYPIEHGWFDGKEISYYNFGTNTPLDPADPTRVLVDGVWAFVTGLNPDGSPIPLAGQNNLFKVAPGDPGYTDLWQPSFITPSEGYVPNSMTSVDIVEASGMTIEKKPLLVNCPFVPTGSKLADDALPIVKGWVNGKPFEYFDFGPTGGSPGKVYAFVTGFDAAGAPRLVPGQHFIFDSAPGAAGYSDFRLVHWVVVDSGYAANTIRAAGNIPTAQITPSTIVVNYPQKK